MSLSTKICNKLLTSFKYFKISLFLSKFSSSILSCIIKLLESARKKNNNNYIKSFFFFFFFFNIYDIKIQKGNVPAVGINKTLFIFCFVLFILFNHDLKL